MDSTILKLLLDNGVAVLVLMAILWSVWQIVRWVGNVIVRPGLAAHLLFLEKAGAAIDAQKVCLEKIGQQIGDLTQILQFQRSWMDQHENRIGEIFKKSLVTHERELLSCIRNCPHGQEGCPLRGFIEQIEAARKGETP